MIYPHLVKFNGVYYPAGTDVPNEAKNGEGVKAPSVEVSGKVETKDEPITEPVKGKKYTEEDLNLPYMKLKALAKKEGFKVENTMKAKELKELLRSV